MKKHLSTILFGLLFLVGLSVMLYPSFSNWWNQHHQTRAVSTYKEAVAQMDDGETERILSEAYAYNEQLRNLSSPMTQFEQIPNYDNILNISGTGIMGYISIPSIKVELPIYHGTSEGVLQIATGHIQGTSLPVGGEDTHAVISGHRGLPSARLFTDLDKMVVGDVFTINILNEVLTYEVEDIFIILPENTEKLQIIPEKDYVTLLTCTPYGINSHRLLIRSHRIATIFEKNVKVSADAIQIDPMRVLPIVIVPLILILVISWNISGKQGKSAYLDEMRKKYRY